jgi:aldehyde dehydrogenase (NAD+)
MNFVKLVENQRAFFNSNQTKEIDFRIHQLKKFKSVLEENEKLLYDSIYNDFKKSEFDTYASELLLIYWEIDEAIKKIRKWSKRKRVKTNLANLPGRSYIIPEPLGVCLVIGAWNYPYQLSFAPAVAAIAAGNTVMLKPSEIPFATSNAIAKIINENFEENYFTVVEGGISETTDLLNQKFDKIFFTGSTTVGKIVYQAAAKNLTPVTLELGGKSPAFVTDDCKLEKSVKRLVWAKFLNSGQTCIAPDYVIVKNSIKEKFLETLKEQIKKSAYSIENRNYTQIINEKNFNRLIELVDKEKIYYGGNNNVEHRFIEPTVLHNVNFDDAVMQEEIFGPILPVISYNDLDEIISIVKNRPAPLACYVFAENKQIKNRILKGFSFGGGSINDAVMHISNPYLPYGGVGESGIGAYHGEAGFKTFSHYKSILEKSFWFEPNLKYPPYTENKLKWIKKLFG